MNGMIERSGGRRFAWRGALVTVAVTLLIPGQALASPAPVNEPTESSSANVSPTPEAPESPGSDATVTPGRTPTQDTAEPTPDAVDEDLVPSEVGAESPSAGPESAAPPVVSVPEVVAPAPAPAPAAAPALAPAPAPTPAPAAAAVVPVRSVLLVGESLWPGEVLTSGNGLFRGVLQSDGNFGVYGPSGVLWASMTPGSGARVSVQSDGNVGFFSSSRVLATNTGGSGDGHRLVMQDDGNLALYSLGGVVIWSSMGGRTGNTRDGLMAGDALQPGQALVSRNGTYRGVLQRDGNFGVYGPSGAIWASVTSGTGARVAVQADGNVGFYSPSRVYATGTGGSGDGHRLVMQDDGNLGLYSVGGVTVWSSKFGRTGNARDSLASGNSLWPGQELVASNGLYRGVLQGDGNFGIYGPSGVLWASMTSGSGAKVVVQADGNVGFYSPSRVYATGTGGTGPGHRLVMQSDGNLGLWSSKGAALWSSRFGLTPAGGGGVARPDLFVYGTLRPGQTAYGVVSPYVVTTGGGMVPGMSLYFSANRSYPFAVDGGNAVFGDLLGLNPGSYDAALSRTDAYERYDPQLPLANQSYVREQRTLATGTSAWMYVATPRQAAYVRATLPWIASGDWLRR